MKKMNILFVMLVASLFAMAQEPVTTPSGAEIKFEDTSHDFGQVKEEAGKATYSFTFTNTGTAPLVVSNAKASCGCTVPNWTKTPIEPGKTGTIAVTYNTTGRPGPFNKSITVTSNAATATTRLMIKGDVLAKAAAPEQEKSAVAK